MDCDLMLLKARGPDFSRIRQRFLLNHIYIYICMYIYIYIYMYMSVCTLSC